MAHIPGSLDAIGPLFDADGNHYAATEREARAGLRAYLRVDRLPTGTEVWPS